MARECILCVDDEPMVLQSLRHELRSAHVGTPVRVEVADSGPQALELIQEIIDDGDTIPLIISDQRMPVMSGDEFLTRAHALAPDSLKILLTGFTDLDAVVRLVNSDILYRYLAKPWDGQDLRLTIHEAIRTFSQTRLIAEQNARIENLTMAMVSALESANHYFDEDTGNHIRRIALLSGFIARKARVDPGLTRLICLYAPLHDIGKVGVHKDILVKPAALSPAEFEHIKEHVGIGHRIIESEAIDSVARNIVLYHHEKWNGKGYLAGLSGTDIPLEARVVALADVFDALVSKRVYKPAMTMAQARDIIVQGLGSHFDPDLGGAFLEALPLDSTYKDFLDSIT